MGAHINLGSEDLLLTTQRGRLLIHPLLGPPIVAGDTPMPWDPSGHYRGSTWGQERCFIPQLRGPCLPPVLTNALVHLAMIWVDDTMCEDDRPI